MGCFTVSKSKKKKSEQPICIKPMNLPKNTPMVLPEPQTHNRALQSAPPSFRTRTQPVQSANRIINNRTRALSAPSSLSDAERDALTAIDDDEQEEPKGRSRSTNDRRVSNPQPLPLPSPQNTSILKSTGSFKLSNASGPLPISGPLPLPPLGALRNFSYEEIVSACLHFSPERCLSEGLSSKVYRASFGDDASGSRRLEATVSCLIHSTQGFKDFVNEIGTLASLQHPHLCKLIGFYAREGSDQRMVVYERLYHGSLDQLLYGRSDGPPVDWCARIKVAFCAAQGLAFLHEEGPFQAMYNEFSSTNIQIDKDFSAKLSGYGCVGHNPDTEFTNTSAAIANLPLETLERGLLTPKSNVWSFGIVLLELLTGRKNLDGGHPKEERNLVKWSRPFLADDCRLSLIIDPRLKGRFPTKAARTVADIALRCLQKDPSERPTMRSIVESLKNIQDMKYSCKFPLQEPSTVAGKQMLRSPSLNGVVTPAPRMSYSPSPPSRIKSLVSPNRPFIPASLPHRLCSSIVSIEDNQIHSDRKSGSPIVRWARVEGF
ncbi:hypothetical protein AAC387_Pa01g0811 [Persea americana]